MAMKLDFDEVLFVGDTASDMMAAKEAHMKSVYVNRFHRPMTVKPDYEIDSLEKLIDIINSNAGSPARARVTDPDTT
jgi:phosphoglycolate phosphatase